MSYFDNAQTVNRIKELLKSQGRSLTFMYNVLNLPVGYLRDVKANKTALTDERLQAIADFINTTTEYLKGETDIKEKAAPISRNDFDEKQYEFFNRFNTLDADLKNLLYQVASLDNEGQQIVSALVSRLAKSQEK